MQYQFRKRLTGTCVTYRYVDANSDEVKDGVTRLEKIYTDEAAAKSAIRKAIPDVVVLKIVSMDPVIETYGLTRDEVRQFGHKI